MSTTTTSTTRTRRRNWQARSTGCATWTRCIRPSSRRRAPPCSPGAGFTRVEHSGRRGDLGADVIAYDHLGRKVVVQCKHYAKPVGSPDVQMFNGTARPVHHAEVPVMVGLNGFTAHARALGDHQDLALVGRRTLKRWAHGAHLYDALDADLDEDRAAA
ncbi:restriction endonuclease [Kitasatospora sp. NBC_00240]|uniref:restriction endonuclease n=1 Tax=Kitasatospora sp. NBC_00240 TaxID=2903567 RepID=UPI00224E3CA7|nr:restriction endonuclease [Kitasatospora sp. NBC_00240]MCX5215744.1 restriction endonuclease [Kitasatospora sp. NBC_00240]